MVRSVLFAALSLFLAATQAVAVNVARDDAPTTELSGTHFVSTPSTTTSEPAKRLSNAERIARGLPLAKPHRRFHGTPVARSATSSVPNVHRRGYIEVIEVDTQVSLGFISKTSVSGAQIQWKNDLSEALYLWFDYSVDVQVEVLESIELTVESWDILNFNLFGCIQGRDSVDASLSVGSFNYGYFGGVTATLVGSIGQLLENSWSILTGVARTVQSSVWTVDLVTGALSLQWINQDESRPALSIFSQGSALYFGGDLAAFNAKYTETVAVAVTLKFVYVED